MTHTFNQSSILDARIGFTWTQGGKPPYLAGVTSLNTQAGIPGLRLIQLLSARSARKT